MTESSAAGTTKNQLLSRLSSVAGERDRRGTSVLFSKTTINVSASTRSEVFRVCVNKKRRDFCEWVHFIKYSGVQILSAVVSCVCGCFPPSTTLYFSGIEDNNICSKGQNASQEQNDNSVSRCTAVTMPFENRIAPWAVTHTPLTRYR